MANLFGNAANANISQRDKLTLKYNAARSNLLVVVGFTLFNVICALFGGSMYFLFSATIPHFIAAVGAVLCGKMPDAYYAEMEMSKEECFPGTVLIIFAAIAIVITALYFLFWIFSKKRVGWLIAALVFFSVDTLALFMLYGVAIDTIMDVLFHAWVLYYLAAGISAHFKLKALPPETETAAAGAGMNEYTYEVVNTVGQEQAADAGANVNTDAGVDTAADTADTVAATATDNAAENAANNSADADVKDR